MSHSDNESVISYYNASRFNSQLVTRLEYIPMDSNVYLYFK